MKYPFISDSHTHSENSFDGKDSVIMLCEKAAQLGLYALTITDHCECHEYYQNNVRQDIEGSIRDILKARGLYTDRLHIYTGIVFLLESAFSATGSASATAVVSA